MPALSFQEEWINKLLRGDKQQKTRPQTDRIKVGDIVNIYNQQRRRITDKLLLRLTADGVRVMTQKTVEGTYPYPPEWHTNKSYAHFLGRVWIIEVYERKFDMALIRRSEHEWRLVNAWARADGFKDFWAANTWFEMNHGEDWINQTWTVIRWNGWQERYFEPEE